MSTSLLPCPLSPEGRARPRTFSRRLLGGSALLAAVVSALAACSATPHEAHHAETPAPLAQSDWVQASDLADLGDTPGWRHQRYGQQRPTDYEPGHHQGRAALRARSEAGNSTLRLPLARAVEPLLRLRFSWFVPRLNDSADLRDADIDDAVVRVILTFDGDRSAFRARDHLLSEIVQLVTGEPLPQATLMYVWDHRYPVGTVIANPHTERIRMLVVQSGAEGLGRWSDIERDVEADYRLAFGEAPGRVTGLGLMSDSNNTGETVQAWFGPLAVKALGRAVPGSEARVQTE
ncbi:MAG: DUF3047 domain-containing protein [Hydrogenophaga sp.]|uniref:DUF3047 domain-containing protein n=1 Tax=Hydrogenophaga sp. TaxID=1904254 RepID=UPI00257BA1A7|nr:DUF3047 domain-containing protein [Hydrogenophaga sp.]MBL0943560.1 DUF3047 domain-containing protein [Hydrogenophaga sp.]